MSRIIPCAAGILSFTIVLSWVAIPTTADIPTNLTGAGGTLPSDSVPIVTSTGFYEAFTPDSVPGGLSGEGSVTDIVDANSPTESQFTTSNVYTTTQNVSNTTQNVPITTQNVSITTQNVYTTTPNVYTTTHNFQNATSSASDVTSQFPTSNTTQQTLPAADEEEKDNIRREATNLRIALIGVCILAGLAIICSIILVICLVVQKRKHNKFQTEFWIEMKRKNRISKEEKLPEMSRNSSTNDMDSESTIAGEETAPKRAHSSAGLSNIYLNPDYPKPELTSFTPPDNIQNNDHGIYIGCDQDNEYYNQDSQNNVYINENSQDNEVYNNISDGINQIPPIPRRENVYNRPSASSEDTGIYSNFKND